VTQWAEKLNKSNRRTEAHVSEMLSHVQHIKLLGVGPDMWRRLISNTDRLGEAYDNFDHHSTENLRGLAFLSMVG
jgi:hypothetical protein